MTAKLIKVGSHYDLYHRIAEENLIIGFASTDNTFEKKLSLKNCQAIEQQFPTQRMWDVDVDMYMTDADGYLILKQYDMTATQWLFEKLWDTPKDKFTWYAILKEAEEMYNKQMHEENGKIHADKRKKTD